MDINKKRVVLAIAMFCLQLFICGQAHTASINLISQSYSVGVYGFGDENQLIYENINSPTPVFFEQSAYVKAYATGNVGQSTASLDVHIYEGVISGIASASITFCPTGALFIDYWGGIDTSDYLDNHGEIKMFDVTTSALVLNQIAEASEYWQGRHSAVHALIPVHPSHTYLLVTKVWNGSPDWLIASAKIALIPAPEPSTMLLLGLGLIGLAGIRRKL